MVSRQHFRNESNSILMTASDETSEIHCFISISRKWNKTRCSLPCYQHCFPNKSSNYSLRGVKQTRKNTLFWTTHENNDVIRHKSFYDRMVIFTQRRNLILDPKKKVVMQWTWFESTVMSLRVIAFIIANIKCALELAREFDHWTRI